jgi:hypothetical protein
LATPRSYLLDRCAVEPLAHFLARLEEGGKLLGHRHLVPGARVSPGVRLMLLCGKSAEAAQLDALAARESVDDLAQNRIDDVLDVALLEVRIASRHALHEFRLDHYASQLAVPAESPPKLLCPNSTSWIKPSLRDPPPKQPRVRGASARCRRVGVIFKMPLNKKVFDVQISY